MRRLAACVAVWLAACAAEDEAMGYDKKHWRGVESGAGEAQCIASGTADVAYVGGPGAPYREYAGLTWAGTPRPMVLSVGSLLSNDGTYKGWSGEVKRRY